MPSDQSHSALLPGELPAAGFVREEQILSPEGPVPLSPRSWRRGVLEGRFPRPVRLTARAVGWRVEDIHQLLKSLRP